MWKGGTTWLVWQDGEPTIYFSFGSWHLLCHNWIGLLQSRHALIYCLVAMTRRLQGQDCLTPSLAQLVKLHRVIYSKKRAWGIKNNQCAAHPVSEILMLIVKQKLKLGRKTIRHFKEEAGIVLWVQDATREQISCLVSACFPQTPEVDLGRGLLQSSDKSSISFELILYLLTQVMG